MRLLILLLAFILSTNAVHAALRVSEEEKAVFAFFQMGERVPHYQNWIFSIMEQETVPPELQQDLYHAHETRLKWGFGTYDHTRDFLKISTKAELFLSKKDEQARIHFRFPGSAGEEYPYFPYQYTDQWIALVVNDLGKFTTVPVTEEQEQWLQQQFGSHKILPVTMRMRIRPLSADLSEPLRIDQTDFWIMTGDIAYLVFEHKTLSGDENEIFSYTAPWYLTETETELLELLK